MSENNKSIISNGLNIAGFIVSIASLFLELFGITGVVGVTFSAVGRSQAVREGSKTGLATAGILLDIIGSGYCWIQFMRLSATFS